MNDSTSNANHMTSNGSMTSGDQVAGKINGSLDFDGSDDFLSKTANASQDITGSLTISAWVKPDFQDASSGPQGFAKILNKQVTGGEVDPWNVYGLGVNNGNPAKFRAEISTGTAGSQKECRIQPRH